MSGKSYAGALDQLLLPLGFERTRRDEWTRRRDGLREVILLEVIQHLGTTAAFFFRNEKTAALLDEAGARVGVALARQTLGPLMGERRQRYWKMNENPKAPRELAEAVRTYGLPFFEGLHALDAQASWCGPLHTNSWRPTVEQLWMAMTLYQMERYDDARRIINDDSRPVNADWRKRLENARVWINERTAGLSSPAS